MAFSINKFNRANFDIDTTDFTYCKLEDLYNEDPSKDKGAVYPVDGMFVHKSELGDSPVIIMAETGLLVNIPGHKADTFRDILADSEAVEAIKAGKVGFTIYTYTARGKTCYSIRFVDIKPIKAGK